MSLGQKPIFWSNQDSACIAVRTSFFQDEWISLQEFRQSLLIGPLFALQSISKRETIQVPTSYEEGIYSAVFEDENFPFFFF